MSTAMIIYSFFLLMVLCLIMGFISVWWEERQRIKREEKDNVRREEPNQFSS